MQSEQNLFTDVLDKYKSYNPTDTLGISTIQKAYDFAQIVFFDDNRLSGRPVLEHCLSVAFLCCDFKLDSTSISTAILHDAYSFGAKKEEISTEVSSEVADMLDNLEKIKRIRDNFKDNGFSKAVFYNDYLRRLIVVLGKDIRVVILRLCEKYDSLKDVEFLPQDKREQVITNMFEIYAPLADLLGLYSLKSLMENRAFSKKDPEKFDRLRKILKLHKASNEKKFEEFEKKLKKNLALNLIPYIDIHGRIKEEYSFNNKIINYQKKYKVSYEEAILRVKDKIAFRIILKTIEDCYKVFAILESEFKVEPGYTDDYIKNPKPNGYKSIHTILDIGNKDFVEVQIRTDEMHLFNEFGAASHTFYKLYGSEQVKEDKIDFLKSVVAWKDSLYDDSKSFELSNGVILTFTPKGEVIELPQGATPVDFAYSVHGKIGEEAVSAKVNGKMVSLTYTLNSGDLVEIVTSKNFKRLNYYDLLKSVKTKEAQMAIKRKMRKSTAA